MIMEAAPVISARMRVTVWTNTVRICTKTRKTEDGTESLRVEHDGRDELKENFCIVFCRSQKLREREFSANVPKKDSVILSDLKFESYLMTDVEKTRHGVRDERRQSFIYAFLIKVTIYM